MFADTKRRHGDTPVATSPLWVLVGASDTCHVVCRRICALLEFPTLKPTICVLSTTRYSSQNQYRHLYQVNICTCIYWNHFRNIGKPRNPRAQIKLQNSVNDLLHTLEPVARLGTPDHQEDHAYEGW